MTSLPDWFMMVFIFFVVFSSLCVGLWRGIRQRRKQIPEHEHLGTIQSALLGLLGLVLGFSFSGAMERFIDRQDALWTEGNAIETAYDRSELLPTAERVRQLLREYAALRLQLFHETRPAVISELTARMLKLHHEATVAAFEGVRQSPQFASVILPTIEDVSDEFARRSAFAHRHLPWEMLLVLLVSCGLSMGTIGFGVGLAERRAIGSAFALAALVAMTLYLTIDFDRPRQGFISLDPTPLENALRAVQGQALSP